MPPIWKPETPAWLSSILSAARQQFTPPADVQGVMEFLRKMVSEEQTKQTIPGVPAIFNAPQKLGGFVANMGLDTMEDMSSPGGAALNTLPEVLPMAGVLAALFKKGDTPLAGLLKHSGGDVYDLADPALTRMDEALNVGAKRKADWADTSRVAQELPGNTARRFWGGWGATSPNTDFVKNTEEALQALAMFERGEPFTEEAARAARITQAGSKVPNLNRAYTDRPLQAWELKPTKTRPETISLPGKTEAMSGFMGGENRVPIDVHATEGVGAAEGNFGPAVSKLRALMNDAEGRTGKGMGLNNSEIYDRSEGAFDRGLRRVAGSDYKERETFAQFWEGIRGLKGLKYKGGVMDYMEKIGVLEPGVLSDPIKLQRLLDELYQLRDFKKAEAEAGVAARRAAKLAK